MKRQIHWDQDRSGRPNRTFGMVHPLESPVDVDFKIEEEDWNVYKLSDGSFLKTRYVLLKVGRTIDQAGTREYGFNSQNLVATAIPAERKGPPTRGYTHLQSSKPQLLTSLILKQ